MITRRMVKPEVSFINLIDVTLVLLVIFMITAPSMQSFIQVDLPSGKSSKARITEGVVITINKDGTIFIDREKIQADDFEKRFSEIMKKRSGEPVFIRGDQNVQYGFVMNVFGTVKDTGIENQSNTCL